MARGEPQQVRSGPMASVARTLVNLGALPSWLTRDEVRRPAPSPELRADVTPKGAGTTRSVVCSQASPAPPGITRSG